MVGCEPELRVRSLQALGPMLVIYPEGPSSSGPSSGDRAWMASAWMP